MKMANRRFGWHSGSVTCRDITVAGDLTIAGSMNFGDASTDTLTVNGAATFNVATTMSAALTFDGADALGQIVFSGTNTEATPALVLPDDTYIADANGALGAAAGFIVVDIGGTNYKLQTYAMS
jgi:hypothetical protein